MARESSMADKREYVRVSVSLPMNPKLGMIDDPAVSWLYVVALCHCGEYLTDGLFIPSMVSRAAGVPAALGKRLVSADLWHEPGHECPRCPQPAEGYMVVHDYLLHQRSKAQAEKVRAAGQAGANARWGKGNANRMRTASGSDSGSHADGSSRRSGAGAAGETAEDAPAGSMRTACEPQCDSDATPNAEVEGEVEEEKKVKTPGAATRTRATTNGRRPPTNTATPEARVANAVDEHLQGMCNWSAIMKIARGALLISGATEESVIKAMCDINDAGKPIAKQIVGQVLSGVVDPSGRPIRRANGRNNTAEVVDLLAMAAAMDAASGASEQNHAIEGSK